MTVQQETMKAAADCERGQLVQRISALERSLATADNDKRLLQVIRVVIIIVIIIIIIIITVIGVRST